ncbi:YHS domain-containing protein, partial [Thermodesulfovibrio sp.]
MKVIDPVCKMLIEDKDAAETSIYKGITYYFCSKHCKEKFDKNPEIYLTEEPSTSLTKEITLKSSIHREDHKHCPKCGHASKPITPAGSQAKVEWTCPMHPEIIRDAPGICPICGMALEPKTVSVDEKENPELIDMRRRFWISFVLTIPLILVTMGPVISMPLKKFFPHELMKWLEFIVATPVVLWGGLPFFVRFWQSISSRNLNMFTLIG